MAKEGKAKGELIMNKKHFYAAVTLLLFLAVGIQPALAIRYIPSDTDIGELSGNTYTLIKNVTDGGLVIEWDNLILDGAGYTVSGTGSGVEIVSKNLVTIRNLNVTGCSDGIHISKEYPYDPPSSITLENNNIYSNTGTGIYIEGGSYDNTLSNNTVSNNTGYGIFITGGSHDNKVIDNDVSGNNDGIQISGSNNNILTNNIVSNNNSYGIRLYSSSVNTLTGNTVSGHTIHGIVLQNSNNNTLENNTASNNIVVGIRLYEATSNTLKYNTSLQNRDGINLLNSSSNQIYNNNFIDNTTQALVTGGSGNVFNLSAAEGGGNYWSDYMGVDENFDGFGDTPYAFTGGQDDLPIFTPKLAITQLIDMVEGINAKEGIINSLDVKLQNALDALDAANAGLRQDAINKMEAFINAVEAQSGNQIEVADANALIAFAEYIIGML